MSASFLLTGEAASTRDHAPAQRSSIRRPASGARCRSSRATSQLDVDDDAVRTGFAGAGAADKAQSFTVGVNWYPASVVKYYLNYERTDFDPGTAPDRPAENIILFRVQLGI